MSSGIDIGGPLGDSGELDRELLDTFLAESAEQLGSLEQALIELEHTGDSPDLLNGIFRTTHSLKGNAACVGLVGMAEAAHTVEGLLDGLRSKAISVTPEIVSALLEAADAFRAMVAGVTPDSSTTPPIDQVLFDRIAELSRGQKIVSGAQPDHGPSSTEIVQARTFRVSSEKLDRVMDLTTEVAMARARLESRLSTAS